MNPHPLFAGFVKAALEHKSRRPSVAKLAETHA
jgi:hypothetical protein